MFCVSASQKTLAPKLEIRYVIHMRIIAKKMLREFWEIHPDAEQALRAWHTKTKQADWESTSDVKKDYRNASFVANNRVIFNIKGKQYRLVVAINYPYQIIYIRFVGTHNEYDKIDTTTI
jgi:mRNA interferase HigB